MLIVNKVLMLIAAIWIMVGGFIFPNKNSAPDNIPVTAGTGEAGDGGIIINVDINSYVTPFLNSAAKRENADATVLYPFVDQYTGTQVTDLSLNVFCQYSATPSEVFSDATFKHNQKIENGIAVDYKALYEGINSFYSRDIDVYDTWFKRCREDGINPWISIRMNDCHCPDDNASFLRSEFFYTARENGWMIGEDYGYQRNCLDYSVPQVREKMLAYIGEQLMRYDVYGIELDWLREIYCFDYINNPDCAGIMNDFLRDVNAVVDDAADKWGHDIKIMCRLSRSPEQSLKFGFDAQTWVNEKLVDVLIAAPHWTTCDSAIPLNEWFALAGNSGVSVCAGIEINILTGTDMYNTTAETVAGYAAQYLTSGSDKIYLYNYYQNPNTPDATLEEIYRTCGNLITLIEKERRFVVTSQDLCPDGFTPYSPLPHNLIGNEPFELKIHTGYIPSNSNVRLIIGLSSGGCHASELTVSVNGKSCTYIGPTTVSFKNTGELAKLGEKTKLYTFEIPADNLPNTQTVTFTGDLLTRYKLDYAEISAEPA